MDTQGRPTCYIIAGPNGAGKTTFALNYLSEIAGCRNFINADMIAFGISPLNSASAQFEASRLFLNELKKMVGRRIDFAFETTLAGRTYIQLLKRLKKDNWRIVLFFLWIPDAEFSRNRVLERVKNGGHDIPEDAIFRRFPRIMYNLVYCYAPLCDKAVFYDNSAPEPILFYVQDENGCEVLNAEIYQTLERYADDFKRNL